jgi:hypothetical protein
MYNESINEENVNLNSSYQQENNKKNNSRLQVSRQVSNLDYPLETSLQGQLPFNYNTNSNSSSAGAITVNPLNSNRSQTYRNNPTLLKQKSVLNLKNNSLSKSLKKENSALSLKTVNFNNNRKNATSQSLNQILPDHELEMLKIGDVAEMDKILNKPSTTIDKRNELSLKANKGPIHAIW